MSFINDGKSQQKKKNSIELKNEMKCLKKFQRSKIRKPLCPEKKDKKK